MVSATGTVVPVSIIGKRSFSMRFPTLGPVVVSGTGILFFGLRSDRCDRALSAIASASSIVLIRRHSSVVSC
jgi:hypothetical protein